MCYFFKKSLNDWFRNNLYTIISYPLLLLVPRPLQELKYPFKAAAIKTIQPIRCILYVLPKAGEAISISTAQRAQVAVVYAEIATIQLPGPYLLL